MVERGYSKSWSKRIGRRR